MTEKNFEGEGLSQEEFLGTMDALGEPPSATARRRMGRRTAAATAVGVAVALGAGSYGIALAANGSNARAGSQAQADAAGAGAIPAGLSSSASGDAPGPGCGGAALLRGLAGTLKSDSGSTLTVQSLAPSRANVTRTVTTNSSTLAVRIASGSLADVANGDSVLVGGTYANNTLTAKNIVTGTGLDQAPDKIVQGSADWLGRGFASGTVTGKTSSGFTVVTTDGAHVTVDTGSSPTIETAVKISVGSLRVGQRVAVSGTSDANGALTATQVQELDTTAAIPGPGLGFGIGFGFAAGPGVGFGPRGFGMVGAAPVRPSDAPSAPALRAMPPNGKGEGGFGFGFRGRGKVPGAVACGSVAATPSASPAN